MPFNKDNKTFVKKRFVVGPRLSQEDFSKAKKESLCFICLSPDHSQWNCPKNKGRRDDEKGKGPDKNHKDRQIHVVQTLPISGNEKYKFIEVLHITDKEHYCCLSTSMWKSSFGPHELVFQGNSKDSRRWEQLRERRKRSQESGPHRFYFL